MGKRLRIASGTTLALALGFTAMILVSSATADEDPLRGTYRAADLRAVKLDLPIGEVRVEGTDGNEVSVAAQIDCTKGGRRCRDAADRVALEVFRTDGRAAGRAGRLARPRLSQGAGAGDAAPAPPPPAAVGQARGG